MIQEKNRRILWVDIFKGLCITFMVMGHSSTPLVIYIYLFHMPAFIFISGFTYNGCDENITSYVWKKFITLFLPFVLINTLYYVFYETLYHIGFYEIFQNLPYQNIFLNMTSFFKNFSTTDLGGATWFLPVLFSIEVMFYVIDKSLKRFGNGNFGIIFAFLLGLLGFYLTRNNIYLRYLFDLSLFGLMYYSIGVFFSRRRNLNEYIEIKSLLIISLIIFIFLGSFYYRQSLPMNWPTRDFDNLFIQLLGSFSGISLTYLLSVEISKLKIASNIFSELGRRTFSILVLHFFFFRLIFVIAYLIGLLEIDYLRELTPRYTEGLQWLIISVLAISLSYLASVLFEKNRILNYIFNARIRK